jgi:hypothetical protein
MSLARSPPAECLLLLDCAGAQPREAIAFVMLHRFSAHAEEDVAAKRGAGLARRVLFPFRCDED